MNYVTEVAEMFLSLNSEIAILNFTDYSTIAEWEKQEIPLVIVLESISEVCCNLKKEDTSIESLSRFKPEVKKRYEIWLRETRTAGNRSLELSGH